MKILYLQTTLILIVLFSFNSCFYSSNYYPVKGQFTNAVFHKYYVNHSDVNRNNNFSGLDFGWFEYRTNQNTGDVLLDIIVESGLYDGYLLDSVLLSTDWLDVKLKVLESEHKEFTKNIPEMPSKTMYYNRILVEIPADIYNSIFNSKVAIFKLHSQRYFYNFNVSGIVKNSMSQLRTNINSSF